MKKKNMIPLKKMRIYNITIVIFVSTCAIIGLSCFQYYKELRSTVKEESSTYMQEIGKQMGRNVTETIHGNFSVLGTIESMLRSSKAATFPQVEEVVKEYRNYWYFKKILLLDENGIAYDVQGNVVDLKSDTYLQEAISNKKPSMLSSQLIDGVECMAFTIPLQGVVINGVPMHAMLGGYDLSSFDKILAMNAYKGRGYAYIIRKDGTIVVRSSAENSLDFGDNILSSLSNAKFLEHGEHGEVKEDIDEGSDGKIEFILGEHHQVMTYTSLGIEDWSLLTFVPADVINKKTDALLNLTIFICAGIMTAFSILLAALLLTFYRNKRKLEQIAYVDPITGGNTIDKFYEEMQEIMSNSAGQKYALIYSNIEKFKVLNEQFGKQACDKKLRALAVGIQSDLDNYECMGRLFADNFCILMKYSDVQKATKRFIAWQEASRAYSNKRELNVISFILEFGIFVIEDTSIPIAHMIDRAKLSLSETKYELPNKLRYALYDEKFREVLLREKYIEDCMESALQNREFQVFLQPKYHTQTEQVGGAEALVRWIRKDGIIYPDEFIPLFERNGFIMQLDKFVFEEVCKTLRRWIEQGLEPVKISVNCSRAQLKKADFLQVYKEIVELYTIPTDKIEIEITENTVFEDVDFLCGIIDNIHKAGFSCSMDDFGSGYSSLNLIQDIPVDTLKLDKVFFQSSTTDAGRTESVVGSIIEMSKALSMITVAEGIEEREQVDMLKRLKCDYIQGFYFAKPLPIDEFEKLVFTDNIEK